MPKFVIERPLPGAGGFSAEDLQAIVQKSNEVLDGMAGRARVSRRRARRGSAPAFNGVAPRPEFGQRCFANEAHEAAAGTGNNCM